MNRMSSEASSGYCSDEEEDDDEELDPRVSGELEKLNAATSCINDLENELDEARSQFRFTLNEATEQLKLLNSKIGKFVDKARPYYESLNVARQASQTQQREAIRYERARNMHSTARESVAVVEKRIFNGEKREFDSALQELLNQSTVKVMEAEKLKIESGEKHQRASQHFQVAQKKVKELRKKLKRSITKSSPYFECKADYYRQLQQHKQRVVSIQRGIVQAKQTYSQTLKSLEEISDEIHHQRKLRRLNSMVSKIHPRGRGVGAESPRDDDRNLSMRLDSSLSLEGELSSDESDNSRKSSTSEEDLSSSVSSSVSSVSGSMSSTCSFDIHAEISAYTVRRESGSEDEDSSENEGPSLSEGRNRAFSGPFIIPVEHSQSDYPRLVMVSGERTRSETGPFVLNAARSQESQVKIVMKNSDKQTVLALDNESCSEDEEANETKKLL